MADYILLWFISIRNNVLLFSQFWRSSSTALKIVRSPQSCSFSIFSSFECGKKTTLTILHPVRLASQFEDQVLFSLCKRPKTIQMKKCEKIRILL